MGVSVILLQRQLPEVVIFFVDEEEVRVVGGNNKTDDIGAIEIVAGVEESYGVGLEINFIDVIT